VLQLETGIGGPLFQIPLVFQPCITQTWVSQCWGHCVKRGIEIYTDLMDITPRRQQDRELMHIFARGGYCDAELALLNCCRMYLKVIWLSDICNGSSTEIEHQFWTGRLIATIHPF